MIDDDDAGAPLNEVKLKSDGTLDGRGHAETSKPTRFSAKDGRRRPGRPKGAISISTAYRRAASMTAQYRDKNGNKHQLATMDAIALKQRDLALKGDDKATKRFEDRIALICPEPVDPLNTARLLAEDAEILARAYARGTLLPPRDEDEGGDAS